MSKTSISTAQPVRSAVLPSRCLIYAPNWAWTLVSGIGMVPASSTTAPTSINQITVSSNFGDEVFLINP